MIAAALAPNEIVIVREITTVWYMFGPFVEAEMRRNLIVRVLRLRSAIALVMNDNFS
jgi:hypothetical protein